MKLTLQNTYAEREIFVLRNTPLRPYQAVTFNSIQTSKCQQAVVFGSTSALFLPVQRPRHTIEGMNVPIVTWGHRRHSPKCQTLLTSDSCNTITALHDCIKALAVITARSGNLAQATRTHQYPGLVRYSLPSLYEIIHRHSVRLSIGHGLA